jgi:hypothetical protein
MENHQMDEHWEHTAAADGLRGLEALALVAFGLAAAAFLGAAAFLVAIAFSFGAAAFLGAAALVVVDFYA